MKIKYLLLALSAFTIAGIQAIVNPELTNGTLRGEVPASGSMAVPKPMPISEQVQIKGIKTGGFVTPKWLQNKPAQPTLTAAQEAQVKELKTKRADLQKQIRAAYKEIEPKNQALQAQINDLYKAVQKDVQPLNKQVQDINKQLSALGVNPFPWFNRGLINRPMTAPKHSAVSLGTAKTIA